jgi:hypothetical protein
MNINLLILQCKLNKTGVTIPRGHISPDVQDSIYKAVGWEVLARTGVKWHEMA